VTTASPQVYERIEMTSTPVLAGFAELYERHYEAVFRAALRVTGSPADAEDVLQTVFLRVLSRSEDDEAASRACSPGRARDDHMLASTARPRTARPARARRGARGTPPATEPGCGAEPHAKWPAAYFRRAAVNAAVDVLRRRAVHAETVYDDRAPHAASEPPLLLKERLRRAIATLEREDATLFLLRHVEGLSIEELAAVFQLEKNNVSVRLHRIRHRLQAEMER